MGINRAALDKLRTMLGAADVKRIERNAKVAERIEQTWLKKLDQLLAKFNNEAMRSIERTGELELDDKAIAEQLEAFFMEHEAATVQSSGRTLHDTATLAKKKSRKKIYGPRSAKAVREAWDEYKTSGKVPKHVADKAAKVKSLYISKVQEMWRKHSDDFIEGRGTKGGQPNPDAFDQEAARKAIQKAMGVSRSRARTIVETETTRYYNATRREFYDEIDTVDGYLFAIVRDSATTKWCLSRGQKGGLVFIKGTKLLNRNTPPCHWNCRSEMLPLSRLNPTHKRILDDEDRRAENNTLVPLPPGWNA